MRITYRPVTAISRLKNRLGWLSISLLMLPILVWVWQIAAGPVAFVLNPRGMLRFVFSGEVFFGPFDIRHAGFCMDQPTIGKWLFWFTFESVTSLPLAFAVGWMADRRKLSGRVVFGIGAMVLCVFLGSILSGPSLWLVQYVCSMGFTMRRVSGLLYVMASFLVLAGFQCWAIRKPRERRSTADLCRTCGYDLTGNMSGTCPECGVQVMLAGED